jgi:RND family efflux transporter MFP subunit
MNLLNSTQQFGDLVMSFRADSEQDLHSQASPKHVRDFSCATLRHLPFVALVGGLIALGIRSRVAAENQLSLATEQSAIATVDVAHPKAGAADAEIAIPGDVQAFTDTPIYARTSGYLKKWSFDIGARVKKGDVLAEIETPEVDAQLRSALADLATARANLQLAQTTANRDVSLLQSHSVSTQERDNAVGGYNANKAIVAAREADVARLQELQSYERVSAPFDGVITARNTDFGAMIHADGSGQARELFHIAATEKLRVYISVPEIYASAARNGASVTLTVDEYPNRNFHGTLTRTSSAIDVTSRTLLAEVDVDNSEGALLPGAYAFVHLALPAQAGTVTVPANALLFRHEGLQVGVVRNGRASLVPVKIGRDYGDTVEITSGLQPEDPVILDPSDSVADGVPVAVRPAVTQQVALK